MVIFAPSILPKLDSLPIPYHKRKVVAYQVPPPPQSFPQAHSITLPCNTRAPTTLFLPIFSFYNINPKGPFFNCKTPTPFQGDSSPPNLHFFLSKHTMDHLTKCGFRSIDPPPHRKFLWIYSSLNPTFLGKQRINIR